MDSPLIKFDKDTFDPLSKITIEAMNKLEKATGWLVTPRGKKKDREIATEEYIKSIKESHDIPPLAKAALITEARRTIRKFCNLNDIVSIAIEQMGEDAKPEKVEKDWFNYFEECAQNISGDEAKILWGKILAEECNKPGAIPESLINILIVMDKENAELFNKVCGFSCYRILNGRTEKKLLIMLNDITGLVERAEINSDKIFDLISLGLINLHLVDMMIKPRNGENLFGFIYGNTIIDVYSNGKAVPVGNFTFTKAGAVLAELICPPQLDDFLYYVKTNYENDGFEVRTTKASD